jgi:hypothetical protein
MGRGDPGGGQLTRAGLIAVMALAVAASAQYASLPNKAPGLSYTRENPPNRVRLALPRVQGQALDHIGMAVPGVVLGLYSDPAPHRLLARTVSDTSGRFDFGKAIPPGTYRLIAMYPGTCTANVPLRISRRARHKQLRLRMEYPGLGVCSYALLR